VVPAGVAEGYAAVTGDAATLLLLDGDHLVPLKQAEQVLNGEIYVSKALELDGGT
jgi:hypothetical protein